MFPVKHRSPGGEWSVTKLSEGIRAIESPTDQNMRNERRC